MLFEELEIAKETDICRRYMGKFPVIAISLKDVEGMEFETAYDMLGSVIGEEARRLDMLLTSDRLTRTDKKNLYGLMEENFEKPVNLHRSLRLLTELLYKHYKIPVIVLIDEYDVPLDKAYQDGFYPEMVRLIRSLFSQVFKTNPYIYFVVITGCLRIAKESIFTGLNNFKVRTISDVEFAEYFGFMDREVRDMLSYYGAENAFYEIKEWYDGYRFGESDVQIEALISEESVEKYVIPELTYTDLTSEDQEVRQTYLWSVLFATGYLTDTDKPVNGVHKLVIPNKEVRGIYEKQICFWFKVKVTSDTVRWKQFCKLFNEFMAITISIRDTYVRKEITDGEDGVHDRG